MTPLKVWHVVGPMERGGAEMMIMDLLRHKSQQTDVSFLVHHRRGHQDGSAAFDPEIKALGATLMHILTPVQSGLRAYLKAFKHNIATFGRPDVIHIHLNSRSGLVVWAARQAGIKRIIVHSHAALTFRGSLAYRLFSHMELMVSKFLFAFYATDFWGCSREAINSLFLRWPNFGQPRIIINNAIDLKAYEAIDPEAQHTMRAQLCGGQDGILIGTVGRIVRHKNFAFLVDVIAALKARNIPAVLAIVGRESDQAYCDEIRAQAAAHGVCDAIRFAGEHADIPTIMRAFDVFAGPALKEGFGLVALEAQAAGRPTVLSMGFPKIIDMGVGVTHFIEDFDADLWADRISSVYNTAPDDLVHIHQQIMQKGFAAQENTYRIERAWRDQSFAPGAKA